MGDRANIHIKAATNDNGVYLYTHGDGSRLPLTLQEALRKRLRWDDDQYLARIIFCEMIKDDVYGELGYGISAYCGDGDHRILKVDVARQTVTIVLEGEPTVSFSFGGFINLKFKENTWEIDDDS